MQGCSPLPRLFVQLLGAVLLKMGTLIIDGHHHVRMISRDAHMRRHVRHLGDLNLDAVILACQWTVLHRVEQVVFGVRIVQEGGIVFQRSTLNNCRVARVETTLLLGRLFLADKTTRSPFKRCMVNRITLPL